MEAGLDAAGVDVTPQGLARAFASAIEERDPEGATALLASNGCLLTPDRTTVQGKPQIREFLAQLTVTHPLVRIEIGRVLVAGPVAVAKQQWRISSKSPGKGLFERTLSAMLVLAKEEEGWRVMIAAPWGV